ncbi:hypothetical protein [Gimesia sp.]|uniref:hypothetical protein n=1 Tax=Gimesia sp. TaxID=2024833 RepID=UPI0032EECA06
MSTQPPPEPRIRFLTLVPILAVLIALGFVWYAQNKAPRVAAGQLIRETGGYAAPGGTAAHVLKLQLSAFLVQAHLTFRD